MLAANQPERVFAWCLFFIFSRLHEVHAQVRLDARPEPRRVGVDGDKRPVDGNPVQVTAEKDPAAIPWARVGADFVVESTGVFAMEKAGNHMTGGAKKVVISAPLGRRADVRDGRQRRASTPGRGSSRTRRARPTARALAKMIHRSTRINQGPRCPPFHAVTATQQVVDGPGVKDWRGGRRVCIIPPRRRRARVGKVLPELNGVLTGHGLPRRRSTLSWRRPGHPMRRGRTAVAAPRSRPRRRARSRASLRRRRGRREDRLQEKKTRLVDLRREGGHRPR